jgi:hypothetical protein
MTRGRHSGPTAASARADRSSRRRHAGQMRGTRRPSGALRTGRVGLARPRTRVPDRYGPWRAEDGPAVRPSNPVPAAQQPGARAPAAHGHDAARSASSPSSTTAVALAVTTARPARKRSSRPRTGRGTNPTGSRRGRRATHIRSGRREGTRGELLQPRSTPAGRPPPRCGARRARISRGTPRASRARGTARRTNPSRAPAPGWRSSARHPCAPPTGRPPAGRPPQAAFRPAPVRRGAIGTVASPRPRRAPRTAVGPALSARRRAPRGPGRPPSPAPLGGRRPVTAGRASFVWFPRSMTTSPRRFDRARDRMPGRPRTPV